MKTLIVLLSLTLLGLITISTCSFETQTGVTSYCRASCANRCSDTAEVKKQSCLKYCLSFCSECQCVPSGTAGNWDECPCYRDMRNSIGQPKAFEEVGSKLDLGPLCTVDCNELHPKCNDACKAKGHKRGDICVGLMDDKLLHCCCKVDT